MPSLRDGILKLASADLSIVENTTAYRLRGKGFLRVSCNTSNKNFGKRDITLTPGQLRVVIRLSDVEGQLKIG